MKNKCSLIYRGVLLATFVCFLLTLFSAQRVSAAERSNYEVSPSNSLYDIANDRSYKKGKSYAIQEGEKTSKLIYDVYSKDFNSVHTKPKVEYINVGRGKENVITFTGWSAIHFYYNHTSSNQNTYISITNSKTHKTKIYSTKQTSLDATDTLLYYGQPKWCSSTKYDEFDQVCNKKYQSVGFKAYIPLDDLINEDGKPIEFTMKIIKQVTRTDSNGDKKTRTVWDDLTIPYFSYESYQSVYDEANLNYSIENVNTEDVNSARVNKSTVLRLTEPGGDIKDISDGSYFSVGTWYKISAQIENNNKVATYFKTNSNGTKYASSVFWSYRDVPSLLELIPYYYTLYRNGYDKDRKDSKGNYIKIYKETDFDTEFSLSFYKQNYSYTPRKTDNNGKKFVNDEGNPLVPEKSPLTGDYKDLKTIKYKLYTYRDLPIYYKTESIIMTRKHVDEATGEEIATAEKDRVKVGEKYSYPPKSTISANGKVYAPVTDAPKNGTVGKRNTTLTFKYREVTGDQAQVTIRHYDQSNNKTLLTEKVMAKANSNYTAKPKAKGYFTNAEGKLYEPVSPYGITISVGTGSATVSIPYKISEDTEIDQTENEAVLVTIRHIDKATKEPLLTEKMYKPINTTFQYPSKETGYFVDKNGDPYMPVKSLTTITTGTEDMTVNIEYTVNPSPPDGGDGGSGYTAGKASGIFAWNMLKTSSTSGSSIKFINTAAIAGNHFATRNPTKSITVNGSSYSNGSTMSSPNSIKDKNITYSFSYEFTNFYTDHYKCTRYSYDEKGNNLGCAEYGFDYRETRWDLGDKPEWKTTLKADHSYKEDLNLKVTDNDTVRLIVGRTAKISGNSFKNSKQEETIQLDVNRTKLKTQTFEDISEPIDYTSDLGNQLYIQSGDAFYFPHSLDESVKDRYENTTNYTDNDYAIPLKVKGQTSNSAKLVLKDNFYVTRNTGMLLSIDSSEDTQTASEETAKELHENIFNTPYDDSVIYDSSKGSRYYLPIDINNSEKPNKWYSNDFVFGEIGLNNITVYAEQKLMFQKYLMGHPKDNPVINEQPDSRNSITYTNKIKIPKDKIETIKNINDGRDNLIHSLRLTDISEVYPTIKDLVSGM
ncbi:MucBP domain-containing protein [Rummeliibacillus pycnus]|uniref:MucBP domain-containing protein n=1 Tax=Rummeliibacillus pycnus TaxID=101070 RepID=UPI003D2BC1D5